MGGGTGSSGKKAKSAFNWLEVEVEAELSKNIEGGQGGKGEVYDFSDLTVAKLNSWFSIINKLEVKK